MVPPRGVGGPAPIFALAIFRPFLIEPLLNQKMMIYHKMPMSGVYENVFQTSEISILLSLRIELLFTICVRIPCK